MSVPKRNIGYQLKIDPKTGEGRMYPDDALISQDGNSKVVFSILGPNDGWLRPFYKINGKY